MSKGSRCRVLLLLTEEDASSLAEAVRVSGAPSRSLLLLESIQAGLRAGNFTGLQHRRNHPTPFWLPKEIMKQVRETALRLRVSQQNLMRHFLDEYLASPPWNTKPDPHQIQGF